MVQLETDEQWNFLKFVTVMKVFDKALRQTFKRMWNKKYGLLHQWDDSKAVRKLLCNKEGGKDKGIKRLTNKSYEEWDTTALCKFTLYAKSFATRDSKGDLKTLDELYIKPRGPNPSGQFHASVISANIDETYALATDQLRLLRNWCSHSTRAEMDKKTFDRFVKLAKDAFKALSVNTDNIDAILKATGSAHAEAQSCDMRFFFWSIYRAWFCRQRPNTGKNIGCLHDGRLLELLLLEGS